VELDARYCGDITYIPTWEGWAYLATVIDLASRRVVGWALAEHMRTELVTDALEMAFGSRRPPAGTIFHSDHGTLGNTRQRNIETWLDATAWCSPSVEAVMFRQRRRRVVLRHPQARARRPAPLADARPAATRPVRIHRGLVQHPATAQLPRTSALLTTKRASITPPPTRRHDHHKHAVRRTGSSPGLTRRPYAGVQPARQRALRLDLRKANGERCLA